MAPTQDDAFHEIQLNGKQLVFLFMAATVVSVVIFLCGVLVGRNVRAERAGAETTSTTTDLPTPAPAPPSSEAPAYTQLDKPGPKLELPKPSEPPAREPTLTRAENNPPPGTSKPAKQPPVVSPPPEKAERPASPTLSTEKTAPQPSGSATTGEPAGQGFAVQIAAVNAKSEADAMARRLTSKGYSAYVLAPASGTPSVFRVRVGKFGTKREAETVAAKLQKEEQLKPWVTR